MTSAEAKHIRELGTVAAANALDDVSDAKILIEEGVGALVIALGKMGLMLSNRLLVERLGEILTDLDVVVEDIEDAMV